MITRGLLLGAVAIAAVGAGQRPVPSHAPAATAPHEVARVNGTSLMSDRLDAAVGQLLPMESFHRNVSGDKLIALRQRALQTIVEDELQYQEGVRQAVRVSDVDVQQAWTQAAARYGGVRAFEAAIRRGGATPETARAEVRRSLIIAKAYDQAVASRCRVSRDDAMQFFGANPARFVEPEQLHIQAITVGVDPSSGAAAWTAARQRAESALREIRDGASFETVALKYSTDASRTKGGDMGFVHRGSLNDRFEQIARDLPLGRVSEVVESLYGYHIVRVTEVKPAQKKSFADVGDKLQEELTVARCTEMKQAWIAGLRARADLRITDPQTP